MKRHARNVVRCRSCSRVITYTEGAWLHAASRSAACGWLMGTYAHPHLIERRNPAWS